MKRLALIGLVGVALAVAPALASSPTAGAAAPSAKVPDTSGTFVSVTPTRLLDTRATGKIAPGGIAKVQVAGRAGIPQSGVGAVVVNLTVTGGTRPGYLSAYPGTIASGTSALNYGAGETRAALATVAVAGNGSITVRNGPGASYAPTHVLVDVQGYYLDGSPTGETTSERAVNGNPTAYYVLNPFRIEDTRSPDTAGPYAPTAQGAYELQVSGGGVISADDISALVLNVTAVNPTANGFLQAWDGVGVAPDTSILNYAKGRVTPNNVVAPVIAYFSEEKNSDVVAFTLRNGASTASTDVLIDVVGVYAWGDDGLVFRTVGAPVRMVDTRTGKGATRFGAASTKVVTAPDGVLNPDDPSLTGSLVGTITAVNPSAGTYLTVWPGGLRPTASNLNPAKAQTVANHAYIPLSSPSAGNGQVSIYNNAGSTDVLVDVVGRFDRTGASTDGRSARSGGRPQLTLADVTRRTAG